MMVGSLGAASAQTFLSPGAMTYGRPSYSAPLASMALAEGRSASAGTCRLWCDSTGMLCYPADFRAVGTCTAAPTLR
ncbi:MAG: hypothetical protein NVS2B5_25200 [Beijerinckiaceae bacterium]